MARPKGQGKTPGSGRRKGTPNKVGRDVRELARQHGPAAIKKLADLMNNAEDQRTQAMAANALLDRGYGKPPQAIIPGDDDGAKRMSFTITFADDGDD